MVPHQASLGFAETARCGLGRLTWSSQHRGGGCDEQTEAELGSCGTGTIVVARSSAGGGTARAAAVLGGDRGRACPVRMRRLGPVCRRLSEQDGSERRAACHQQCLDDWQSRRLDDTCRLPNGRDLRSCVCRASAYGRSPGKWGGRRQQSRGSCGATRPRAAAGCSIGPLSRNGMRSGRRGVRSGRS